MHSGFLVFTTIPLNPHPQLTNKQAKAKQAKRSKQFSKQASKTKKRFL
jgi:hypothetical protein